MLIESIIQRKNGTTVTLDGVDYRFQPTPDDKRHLAEVEHEPHVMQLLAIKEGFRPADGSFVVATIAAADIDGPFFIVRGPQDLQAFAQWAESVPSLREEPGEFVSLTDKIAFGEADLGGFPPAPVRDISLPPANVRASGTAASGPTPQAPPTSIEPNQSPAGEAEGAAAGELTSGDGGGGVTGGAATEGDEKDEDGAETSEDDPAERERLAARYAEIKGHRPNGRWKIAKIAAAIAEHEG